MRHPRLESMTKRDRGFSLIELLTVVGLIGVLAAIGIPRVLNYMRFFQIRAGATQVASELQAARSQAIKRNTNFGVVFVALSATTYQWCIEDVTGVVQSVPASATRCGTPGTTGDSVQTLPTDIQFLATGPGRAIRFMRLGNTCLIGAVGCTTNNLPGATNYVTDVPAAPCVAGDLMITLQKATQTGLTRTICVAPGGRVKTAL